jgi:hypothetical protein
MLFTRFGINYNELPEVFKKVGISDFLVRVYFCFFHSHLTEIPAVELLRLAVYSRKGCHWWACAAGRQTGRSHRTHAHMLARAAHAQSASPTPLWRMCTHPLAQGPIVLEFVLVFCSTLNPKP